MLMRNIYRTTFDTNTKSRLKRTRIGEAFEEMLLSNKGLFTPSVYVLLPQRNFVLFLTKIQSSFAR